MDWVTSQDWFGFVALDHTGLGECMSIRPISGGFDAHHCIYIYIYFPNLIRYVYSIDHVTCSTYVCICAAAILAILVLLATFELTE